MSKTNPNDYINTSLIEKYPNDWNGKIENTVNGGLTKREYFAAMAMQGIVTEQSICRRIGHQEDGIGTAAKAAAIMAIECADALIAELNKMGDGHE